MGRLPMASVRHVLQPDAFRSGVHCARVYSLWNPLKLLSLVANFLSPAKPFAASAAAALVVSLTSRLNRFWSVILPLFRRYTPGRVYTVPKNDRLE
uniref:Uncharacterized protein n=1 Tax=Cannabis sativa TaxID=3483 RepID=A0A803QVN0_CANSA